MKCHYIGKYFHSATLCRYNQDCFEKRSTETTQLKSYQLTRDRIVFSGVSVIFTWISIENRSNGEVSRRIMVMTRRHDR